MWAKRREFGRVSKGTLRLRGAEGLICPKFYTFFLLCPNFPHCSARIWEGSCPPAPPPRLVRPWWCGVGWNMVGQLGLKTDQLQGYFSPIKSPRGMWDFGPFLTNYGPFFNCGPFLYAAGFRGPGILIKRLWTFLYTPHGSEVQIFHKTSKKGLKISKNRLPRFRI